MTLAARHQLAEVVGGRVVERNRAVGQAADELLHDLGGVVLQLLGVPFAMTLPPESRNTSSATVEIS